MTFKDFEYKRPDIENTKSLYTYYIDKLCSSASYAEARAVFLEKEKLDKELGTMIELSSIRHSIDTRDSFYSAESDFWNSTLPELGEYVDRWDSAMLESPFRADFTKEFGELMFINSELSSRCFSPKIIPELQKENELDRDYDDLIASSQIDFDGRKYTISQIAAEKSAPDDERRLAAWKAEGQWYKDNQKELDRIYDELVHLRDTIGRKLGYDGYTQLGYNRMQRNCYTKDDVEKFRAAVIKYLVPVAEDVYRAQAKRLGKEYPMSFADNALDFRSGNPKPVGSADDILAAGKRFYEALSPITGEFFNKMLDEGLLDVLSTEGKMGGGYCTQIWGMNMPFIFANFSGTQADVEVVTHEAGHAFAFYMNRDRVPHAYCWPGMEACEVHSMSMEFFAESYAEEFFGKDADKYRYAHLSKALTFIPYGTMVDHFQHIVYEKPELTPAERHAEWKHLLGVYMPWMKLDGEIPFYSEGEGWQRQSHIYTDPFYYIDYCLAQTVALEFWSMLQSDRESAWQHYMDYTLQGGSNTFTNMLRKADLESPFDENCLKNVCTKASEFLSRFDMNGIE